MGKHKNDVIDKIEYNIKHFKDARLAELYAQYSNWLGIAAEELSEDYDDLLEAVRFLESMIADEYMKQHNYYISYQQDFRPWVKGE